MGLARALVAWFEESARDLPWRGESRDPYSVLVSEIMLQQTQVERVVPRYLAFLERFPDLEALARATEDEVVEAWSGLGYYRRARLLHAAARAAGQTLPESAARLRELPGVGPYTAAAVASLAFGEKIPVLDGNVLRVASRFLALGEPSRSSRGRRVLTGWVTELMDEGEEPGRINEALMELGAVVCMPSSPRCGKCPLSDGCAGRASGEPERWPEPRTHRSPEEIVWVAPLITDERGRLLVRQVRQGPILRGLWLPPFGVLHDPREAVGRAGELAPIPAKRVGDELPEPVRHSITHRRITIYPVPMKASTREEPQGCRWINPLKPGVPTSSLLAKLVSSLRLRSMRPGGPLGR